MSTGKPKPASLTPTQVRDILYKLHDDGVLNLDQPLRAIVDEQATGLGAGEIRTGALHLGGGLDEVSWNAIGGSGYVIVTARTLEQLGEEMHQ